MPKFDFSERFKHIHELVVRTLPLQMNCSVSPVGVHHSRDADPYGFVSTPPTPSSRLRARTRSPRGRCLCFSVVFSPTATCLTPNRAITGR